jgi:hypothetical protein
MAGHPNNSFRGLWAKEAFIVPGAKGLMFETYSESTNLLTANSTGLAVAGGVKLSSQANATLTGNSTGVVIVGGVKISNQANGTLTGNSTGVVATGAVKVNNAQYIKANSTGFSFGAKTALPSARTAGYNWAFLTNSTGVSAVMLRTTGTTWKYLNVTSVLPT